MTKQGLEQVLVELEVQLESSDDLSPEQVVRLRAAADDIRSTLESSERSAGESVQEVDAGLLSRQWDEATRGFTESHPVLASTLGRIADLLAQIGI